MRLVGVSAAPSWGHDSQRPQRNISEKIRLAKQREIVGWFSESACRRWFVWRGRLIIPLYLWDSTFPSWHV